MDAETILLAKKFSGGADVSAAKQYRDAAQAAAQQAASAAASVPSNVTATLNQLTQDMADLETAMENIGQSGISMTGNNGDVLRVGQNGSIYAGDRPVTLLMDVMVPQNVQNDTSNVTWLTDANDKVSGFVITADSSGKTIDSYNHDTYLLAITNTVNDITNERVDAQTTVMDIDYVTASSDLKSKRTRYMHNLVPYSTAHQVEAVIGINPAGCAYLDMRYGTSQTSWQFFPGLDVTSFERRYQNERGTDHVNAISFILQGSTLRYGTVIRLWKM